MKFFIRYLLFPVLIYGGCALGIYFSDDAKTQLITIAAVAVSTALILAIAERILPFYHSWNQSHNDIKTDILHLVVSNLSVPEILKLGLFAAGYWLAGQLEGYLGYSLWPTHWHMALQLLLALVIGEFGQYWAHRLAHESSGFLWSLHATHHSPTRLYWLNAGRDHPLGTTMLFTAQIISLLVLGAPQEVIALMGLFTAIHGLGQHCNVDLRLGFQNYIFSMAELHRWHHSLNIDEANHNYGANLIVWDLLFGTFYWPKEVPPEKIGIADMPDFPQNYLGQLKSVFVWGSLTK